MRARSKSGWGREGNESCFFFYLVAHLKPYVVEGIESSGLVDWAAVLAEWGERGG